LNGKVQFLNIAQVRRALALLWRANVPTALIGGVGCGKTTAVEEFVAALNTNGFSWELWTLPLAYMDPTDIGGIPTPESERVRYLLPPFLPFDPNQKGVIFGDEFDRATSEVQNAFLQVLLGRKIHGVPLSPNAYVVLAMNGESDMFTTPLSYAARTRICSLFVSSNADGSLDSYEDWAMQNGISPLMMGFARFRPDLLRPFEEFEELAIATPRTRDMADRILTAAAQVQFPTEDILLPCLAGVVGKATALEILAYRELFDKAPKPQEVLKNPTTAPIPERLDIVYSLCSALLRHVATREQAGRLVPYAVRLPDELCAFTLRMLAKAIPDAVTLPEYIQWQQQHSSLLI